MQYNCIRKVADNMSFVGLHNTDEGIIGFADSKATIRFETGLVTEDKKRGRIKKIFKNNQFIFAAHGNNELFSERHKTYMEDYIAKYLSDDIDYKSFFFALNDRIQSDKASYNDGIYQFIIGSKNSEGQYYLLECTINQNSNSITFSEKDFEKGFHIAGYQPYLSIYQTQSSYSHLNISQYASMVKQYVEKIIEAKDIFSKYEYNPAGKPVYIEIFQ